MELKLFLYIDACGMGEWYCYETFEEFYEEIINDFIDVDSDEFSTKEKVQDYFEECPYIHYFEVTPDTVLKFSLNDGECSSFPDDLLNVPEDTQITTKEFLKYCEKGYLGFELFEIL